MLVHQIPPNPPYLRAKVGKRLARIGAIAVKNAVYVLPTSDTALEQFQWLRTEVVDGGGDATILSARFVEGLTDADVVAMFRAARDADYAALRADARLLGKRPPKNDDRRSWEASLDRIETRLDEIAAIDFFSAPGGEAIAKLVAELRARLDPPDIRKEPVMTKAELRDRVWVTRSGVKIDRIASAWLVRRFVDENARFKFVAGHAYEAEPGEIRFDMTNGELTHEGDRCTFEVIVARLGLEAPGLSAVAEIVHEIDLDDDKYARSETAGVAAMMSGLIASSSEDASRIEQGITMLDSLLAHLAQKSRRRARS